MAVVRTGGFLGTRRWSSQVAITLTERLNLGEVFLVQNFKNVKCYTFYELKSTEQWMPVSLKKGKKIII